MWDTYPQRLVLVVSITLDLVLIWKGPGVILTLGCFFIESILTAYELGLINHISLRRASYASVPATIIQTVKVIELAAADKNDVIPILAIMKTFLSAIHLFMMGVLLNMSRQGNGSYA